MPPYPLGVLVDTGLNSSEQAQLRSLCNDNIQLFFQPEFPRDIPCTILVNGRPTRDQLADPHVHHLIIPWAGVPESTRQLLLEFPHIAVHNLHHNARAVAEMGLALLLAVAQQIVPADQKLRKGDWSLRYQRPFRARTLQGRSALIVGYGSIGRELASLLTGIGLTVNGVRRSLSASYKEAQVTIYGLNALPNLLPDADICFLTLPHTATTTGMFGKAELARLPAKAILINLARAAIVDEEALFEALNDGHLFGAGLDVWYQYPQTVEARTQTLPAERPFHTLENVVLSPHRAGHTPSAQTARLEHMARLLNQAARGEQMDNQVDVARGY